MERALQAIEGRKAAGAALYATEETPADDSLHFPHQTACQLLAWYTLTRLDRLGVGGGRLVRLAQSIQDAVCRHQVLADSAPSRYAYATDLTGGKLDYHDANDLPMALAPYGGSASPTTPCGVPPCGSPSSRPGTSRTGWSATPPARQTRKRQPSRH